MPGVEFHSSVADGGLPDMVEVLVGKSTTIRKGDLLLLCSHARYTASANVVRPVVSSDVMAAGTRDYAGVAPFDIFTDSSGNPIQTPAPVTLSGPQVAYAWPSMAEIIRDAVTGYLRVPIYRWSTQNRFKIKAQSDDTINFADLHSKFWIIASAATPPANYNLSDDDPGGGFSAGAVLVGVTPDDAVNLATAGATYGIVSPLAASDAFVTGSNPSSDDGIA